MILLTTFFMNALCAIVPCPPQFPGPEIDSAAVLGFRDGIRRYRNINNATDEKDLALNILETTPRVDTRNGAIEGYFMRTVSGRDIYAFEGIPFAEPPVGSLRFEPPVAKAPWKQVLQAKRVSSECLQYNPFRGFRVIGNEDCLYLNVYTPQIYFRREEEKLPVIVWIHGGFYNFGTGGEYGPAYMLEKDVIVVTLNYRLGVLGFLSTADKVSPGNNGLRDQAMALKWVSENIEAFGGDAKKITVMGFSAGGSSLHFHMLNNETRKYFKQGISFSGTAFNVWSMLPAEQVRNSTILMANIFRCPTASSQLMVNCLKRQSPAGLVARQSALFPKWPYPYVLFTPVVENPGDSQDPMISKTPHDVYAEGGAGNMTWITTMTKQEGHFALLFPSLMGRMPTLRRNWRSIAPDLLVYGEETNDLAGVTDKVTEYYMEEDPLIAPMDSFSQAYTDRHFGMGMDQALKHHAKIAPTYAYVFDYMGNYHMGNLIGYRPNEWGVGHAEDVFYLFNSSSSYSGFKKTDPEFKLSAIMVNIMCNFARTSEPVYTDENGTVMKIWDRIEDTDNMNFLQLSTDVKMVPQPHQDRLRFWKDLNLTSLIHNKNP